MIDTHSHIQFKIFDESRDQVILDAKKAGVNKIIAVGTNLETSKKAVQIAEKYPEVFASLGIHPHHVFEHLPPVIARSEATWQSLNQIESILRHPKVLAVGETGMDRYDYPNTKYPNYLIDENFISLQREIFALQIRLAIKHAKALIVHIRKAVEDTLAILKQEWSSELEKRTVFHMCEPDLKLLNFAMEHKVFISFGGDITYDLGKQEFLKKVPLELLVLETDSPFFIPKGFEFPNTPASLNIIAQKIAEIKKVGEQKIKKVTLENSIELFGIN